LQAVASFQKLPLLVKILAQAIGVQAFNLVLVAISGPSDDPSARKSGPLSYLQSATPLQGRLNGNGREFEDFLVLQVGVGSAVSASLARQIENAIDWPERVEGAGVAALERHLAGPVVVDPVLVA
jgi:hypothetical protein